MLFFPLSLGVVLITASLVEMSTALLLNKVPEIDCDVDSLHELERALRKISDEGNERESFHEDATDCKHLLDDRTTQAMVKIEEENVNDSKLEDQDMTVTQNLVGKDESKDVIDSKHGAEDMLLLDPIAEEGEKQSLSDLDS